MTGSAWLPWPARTRLAFEIAGGHEFEAPFDAPTMRDCLAADPDDPDLAAALEVWFSNYSVAPADVWDTVRAHTRPLPAGIARSLGAYAARANSKQIAELTAPMIRRSTTWAASCRPSSSAVWCCWPMNIAPISEPNTMIPAQAATQKMRRRAALPSRKVGRVFLRACEYERAHAATASAAIIARADASIANEQSRSRLLEAWIELNPSDSSARSALIEGVAVPYIERAIDFANALLASGSGHLVAKPPKRVRTLLRTTIEQRAKGTTSEKHLTKRMQELDIADKPSAARRITAFFKR